MPRVRTIAFNDSQVKLNILTSDNATYQDDYSQWQPGQVEYTHQWQCHAPGWLQSMTAKSNWIYSPMARPHTRTITISGSQVNLNILMSPKATCQDDYCRWQRHGECRRAESNRRCSNSWSFCDKYNALESLLKILSQIFTIKGCPWVCSRLIDEIHYI